jgi:hypothetical protein
VTLDFNDEIVFGDIKKSLLDVQPDNESVEIPTKKHKFGSSLILSPIHPKNDEHFVFDEEKANQRKSHRIFT